MGLFPDACSAGNACKSSLMPRMLAAAPSIEVGSLAQAAAGRAGPTLPAPGQTICKQQNKSTNCGRPQQEFSLCQVRLVAPIKHSSCESGGVLNAEPQSSNVERMWPDAQRSKNQGRSAVRGGVGLVPVRRAAVARRAIRVSAKVHAPAPAKLS